MCQEFIVAELKIFSGNAHKVLANRVVDRLRMDLGVADVSQFSDGEISVEIHENVVEKTFLLSSRHVRLRTII